MTYYSGQIVTVEKKRSKDRFHLLSYKGIYINSCRVVKFKLKEPLPDGRSMCYYELWECIDLSTGSKELKKFPVYIYEEAEGDYVESDRQDVIDDNHEVTSLLDSYACWEYYIKTGISKRVHENETLDKVNKKHNIQLSLLKKLEQVAQGELRVGVRLKIIMKETPNSIVLRELKTWIKNNPELFHQIQSYAYMSNNNSSFTNKSF